MKAILEFNLPEEEWEHYASVKGREAFFVLHNLWQWLMEQDHKGRHTVEIEEIRNFLKDEAEHYLLDFWNIP